MGNLNHGCCVLTMKKVQRRLADSYHWIVFQAVSFGLPAAEFGRGKNKTGAEQIFLYSGDFKALSKFTLGLAGASINISMHEFVSCHCHFRMNTATSQLMAKMAELRQNRSNADVTINCEGEVILVHSLILDMRYVLLLYMQYGTGVEI